jgi:hypothetical protein
MENKVIAIQFGTKPKPLDRSSSAPAQLNKMSESEQVASANLSPVTESAAVDMDSENMPKNDFRSLADRNRSNAERLRKERELANKAVLKSYRIK